MSSSNSNTIAAAASYQKIGGTLSFNSSTSILTWSPSSTTVSSTTFSIQSKSDVSGLSVSKADSPNVALMVMLKSDHQAKGIEKSKLKVMITFTSTRNQAETERENFKLKLAAAIKSGQSKEGTSNSITSTPSNPITTASSSTSTSKPTKADIIPRKSDGTPLTELDYRVRVLKANPSLLALHREVVGSKEMTDADFWSHPSRASLVRAEKALAMQKAGRNARIADPRPKADSKGQMILNITPEIIRDMFEQFPVVGRAYDENVPNNMDESSFWTRYFESKLYHRLRTSARSAASEHMVADDDIFDKYLEAEDNEDEPRRQVNAHDAFLDLGSTAEDHQETGNSRDWTMRAGAERRTLPLMRRFNDHSQSLLDSALGAQEDEEDLGDGTTAEVGGSSRMRKKRRIVGGVGEEYGNDGNDDQDLDGDENRKDRYYNGIVIDDLEEENQRRNVPLDVRGSKGFFQGSRNQRNRGGEEIATKSDSELKRLLSQTRRSLDDPTWQNDDLGNFSLRGDRSGGIDGGSMAMSRMLGNIRDKIDAKSGGKRKANLLETTSKALISNQTTTTEFLRQYWSFVAPQPDPSYNPDEGRTLSGNRAIPPIALSMEQRKVKAASMKERLRRTEERVKDLIKRAEEAGEPDAQVKILSALGPTHDAVRRALGEIES